MDILLHLTSTKINHDHRKAQQTPQVADPQSSSVPRRLLCKRLEVLIHLTLLRLTCGAGSRDRETASKSVRLTDNHLGDWLADPSGKGRF